MKLEERRLLDQVLSAEEPCLGAVFCSYTFDPTFFEEEVLRTVLRLRSDPEEAPAHFLREAREALQASPVVCMVDAEARQPGQRLPYELHLVRSRTFHPKVYLVLFETHARVAIGSGNLTKSGLGQNTEAFFSRKVAYGDPAGTALLRDVARFLDASFGLTPVGRAGARSQYADVRAALEARLTGVPAPTEAPELAFVSSFDASLVSQLGEALPADAKITRVGVLAPFFELDDAGAADSENGLDGAIAEVLALRPSKDATLDIALPWDDAPISPPPNKDHSLAAGTNRLWARLVADDDDRTKMVGVEYFVVRSVGPKRVEVDVGENAVRRVEREALEWEIEHRRAWPVGSLRVHAPKAILTRIVKERPVRLWLHPATSLTPRGRPQRRTLHAKAIFVTAERRGKATTTALIGSANASRAALQRPVADTGNVEACVLCRFDGEVTVRDFLPSLVNASFEDVELSERPTVVRAEDYSAWIADVVHDAKEQTLTIAWHREGPSGFGSWTLAYADAPIASGNGAPAEPTVVKDFVLQGSCAEIVLATGGHEWALPIRVEDMAALPPAPGLPGFGLRELLALLGRRVGAERLQTLGMERGPAGVGTLLDVIFGDGFGATDVFRAWWGLAEDLGLAVTVPSFRQQVEGPMGARAVWALVRDDTTQLSNDEKWVYGCELLRELGTVQIADGPDAPPKREMLAAFRADLVRDLGPLGQEASASPWMPEVAKFYGLEVPR